MTDNIPALIAEARGRTYTPSRPALLIARLADALEAEHKRADSVQFALDGFRSVAARDNAYLIERAEMAEAERDRYRAALIDAKQMVTTGMNADRVIERITLTLDDNGEEQ